MDPTIEDGEDGEEDEEVDEDEDKEYGQWDALEIPAGD